MQWNLYDGKDAKWKATQLQALYIMTREVMATSTTRGRLKKLIDSEIDVGTAGIVNMMTIDIRTAPQRSGDIAFHSLVLYVF